MGLPRIPVVLAALGVALGTGPARAQGPAIPSPSADLPGDSRASALGPIPGSPALGPTDGGVGDDPGGQVILRTEAGISGSRVPGSILYPGRPSSGIRDGVPGAPPPIEADAVPLYGLYEMPAFGQCIGPTDGMTLDQLLDRLCRANPELRALATEIPQARADVLTSGLRGNPLLFADAQQVPYGSYSTNRPGGARYDVSLTYPIDLNGKRRARTAVAVQTVRVLEAQYQDAVRRKIGQLYQAFVQCLDAYERLRLARAARDGIEALLAADPERLQRDEEQWLELQNRKVLAELSVGRAEDQLDDQKDGLRALLDIPSEACPTLEVKGVLDDPIRSATMGKADEEAMEQACILQALQCRPDLIARRLGVGRAQAIVGQARSARFEDVYLLYQPYTFQDNAPIHLQSTTSWAVGATVALPVFNRNEGNIQRARINVDQTRLELDDWEKRVRLEAKKAVGEYAITLREVVAFRDSISRNARRIFAIQKDATRPESVSFADAVNRYNRAARAAMDARVRHRRSMLELNVAVGRRVLP